MPRYDRHEDFSINYCVPIAGTSRRISTLFLRLRTQLGDGKSQVSHATIPSSLYILIGFFSLAKKRFRKCQLIRTIAWILRPCKNRMTTLCISCHRTRFVKLLFVSKPFLRSKSFALFVSFRLTDNERYHSARTTHQVEIARFDSTKKKKTTYHQRCMIHNNIIFEWDFSLNDIIPCWPWNYYYKKNTHTP